MIILKMCYRLRVLFQNYSKILQSESWSILLLFWVEAFCIVSVVFLPTLVFFSKVLFNLNSPFKINYNHSHVTQWWNPLINNQPNGFYFKIHSLQFFFILSLSVPHIHAHTQTDTYTRALEWDTHFHQVCTSEERWGRELKAEVVEGCRGRSIFKSVCLHLFSLNISLLFRQKIQRWEK